MPETRIREDLLNLSNLDFQAGSNVKIGTLDNFNLTLRTNNNDRLTILNNGNVGIGTTNPQGQLDLGNQIKFYYLTRPAPTVVNNYVDIGYISGNAFIAKITITSPFGYQISAKNYIIATDYLTPQGWRIVNPITSSPSVTNDNDFDLDVNWSSNYGPLYIRIRAKTVGSNPPDSYLFITIELNGICSFTATSGTGSVTPPSVFFVSSIITQRGGNVGIGTTNPSYTLHVVGNAAKTVGGTAWVDLSDKRLKNIEGEVTNILDKITLLRPVKYSWNNLAKDKFNKIDEGIMYGFIAQEMKEVFPQFISENSDGYLTYNPSGYEAVLTAAIQELNKKVEVLIEKVNMLETKLQEITNQE